MSRAIQAADQYSANGQCGLAHRKVGDARFLLSRLPSSVDKGTRQGLTDGLGRLDSLITSECQQPQKTQTQTTPTVTETQTTPTTTPSTTTPTTPTTTTPTTTGTTPTTTGTTPTTTTGTTTTGNGGTPPPP
jgi:hypothetical protein